MFLCLCMIKSQEIDISSLENNNGQIVGLPKNPRFIKDVKFAQLVKSIKDLPEMLELRELLVVARGKKFIVIGGNMRLRAMKELKFKKAHCKVLPAKYPLDKLKEIAIKDNVAFGQDDWDILGNEWDLEELQEWGMKIPNFDVDVPNNNPETDKKYFISITCENETQCQELYEKFQKQGLDVKIVT